MNGRATVYRPRAYVSTDRENNFGERASKQKKKTRAALDNAENEQQATAAPKRTAKKKKEREREQRNEHALRHRSRGGTAKRLPTKTSEASAARRAASLLSVFAAVLGATRR